MTGTPSKSSSVCFIGVYNYISIKIFYTPNEPHISCKALTLLRKFHRILERGFLSIILTLERYHPAQINTLSSKSPVDNYRSCDFK